MLVFCQHLLAGALFSGNLKYIILLNDDNLYDTLHDCVFCMRLRGLFWSRCYNIFFIEATHFFSKTGRHQYNQSLDGTYITWHFPCNKMNRKIEHPLENEICMSNFLVFRHHHFSLPLVVLLVCYLRVGCFQIPDETPMGTKNLGGNWKTPTGTEKPNPGTKNTGIKNTFLPTFNVM